MHYCVRAQPLICVRLFATPWTIAHQAPPSMGLSKQEYWSGLPFPSPEDLPDPGIEPLSPALAGRFFTTESSGKPQGLRGLKSDKEMAEQGYQHRETNPFKIYGVKDIWQVLGLMVPTG